MQKAFLPTLLRLLRCWVVFTSVSFFVLFSVNQAFAAFSITDVSPATINSPEDVITITASASGLQNNTQYLEAAFTKEGESANYFGLTKNKSEEWYQYKSSPSSSDLSSYFYSFLPVNGVWSGQILAKIDIADSGYKGPGNYTVKLLKFITSSSTSSNTLSLAVNITLTSTPIPTPTTKPTATNTPTPTTKPSATNTVTPTTKLTGTLSPTGKLSTTLAPTSISSGSSILGESTKSATKLLTRSPTPTVVKTLGISQTIVPFIFIVLGSISLGVCGILIFLQMKKDAL